MKRNRFDYYSTKYTSDLLCLIFLVTKFHDFDALKEVFLYYLDLKNPNSPQ